jgi:predicted TPR repeat methyltransferase
VVDLGCGTGLFGVALAGQCRSLTGVDLSHEMLARARDRNIYDALVEDDLVTALAAMPEARADAVVAVDVLVYIGAIEGLFA